MNTALAVIVLILLVALIWLALKWMTTDVDRYAFTVKYENTANQLERTYKDLRAAERERDWLQGVVDMMTRELEAFPSYDAADPLAAVKVARDQIARIGAGLR